VIPRFELRELRERVHGRILPREVLLLGTDVLERLCGRGVNGFGMFLHRDLCLDD
jgi:hypothetical protein